MCMITNIGVFMNTSAQKTLATSLDVLSLSLCLSFPLLYTLSCSLLLTYSLSLSLSLSLSFRLALSLALSLLPSFRSFSLAFSTFPSLSLLSLFIYVHTLVDIHADIERGVAEEHLQQPDSKEGFSTNNYGVRYTIFTRVCNKFGDQTQFLSSLFDLLK